MKANYTYLSDGTKAKALNASSAGYDYAGSFTYSHASNGTKTLESVAFGGKEEQDSAFGIAYSDFGARFYDRSAAAPGRIPARVPLRVQKMDLQLQNSPKMQSRVQAVDP